MDPPETPPKKNFTANLAAVPQICKRRQQQLRGTCDSSELEELEQMAAWFREEGLGPDSPKEAQLCFLWRAHQHTRSYLNCLKRDLNTQRLQHLAEMSEVRKSLEQIRIFTEHKDVLAQEIQDENDQLKDRLQRLITVQDAQISEVAKMLYQQGLTELIHSSPSEQVAYLLVERASLLEMSEGSDKLTGDGNTASPLETETQVPNSNARQAEDKRLTEHASSVKSECSRLERDLEEGSRRLAMAHSEIRRLTDELESAHLTQRAYEPELQAAQQEVEQLRQEVEKLKKYEMVEMRKAKELNDRLDLEIRALRGRVRSLDAEKNSLYQKVVCLQKELEQLKSSLQQQQQTEQQLQNVQVQDNQTKELATIHSLKQLLDNSPKDLDNIIAAICTKEYSLQRLWKQKVLDVQQCQNNTHCQLEDSFTTVDKKNKLQMSKEITLCEDSPDHQGAVRTLVYSQDECETLKKEICETLKSLDKERSKYHEMKEKHKAKLCRAKQKFENETTWRDEKIKSLERELSLCSHSLAKEKELVIIVSVENEKLLAERRILLQQLNDEEHSKKDSNLTASLSQCRGDFLEMENKKLGNKILHMSNQLAALERTLQNMQAFHFAEELKKIHHPHQIFTSLSLQNSSVVMPDLSEIQTLLDDAKSSHMKQTDMTSSPHCFLSTALSRSTEMGYLNLSSTQSHSVSPAVPSSSESRCF